MNHIFALNALAFFMTLAVVARAQTTCLMIPRDPASSVQQHLIHETRLILNTKPEFTFRAASASGTEMSDLRMYDTLVNAGVQQRRELGQTLSSDLLILIDTREQKGQYVVDLVAIEPAMGIRLNAAVLLWDTNRPHVAAQVVVDEIIAAQTKRTRGIKTVFAIPAFESKDLTPQYRYMMEAYPAWVERLLLHRDGAVVVELAEAETLALMQDSKNGIPLPIVVNGSFLNKGVGPDRVVSLGLEMSRGGHVVGSEERDDVPVHAIGRTIHEMLDALLVTVLGATTEPNTMDPHQGGALLKRADALGLAGFWDNAIPLYFALMFHDAYSEQATLGLLEAYGALLQRNMKRRHEDPLLIVGLGEKIVDLVSTLPTDWRVSNRARLQAALRSFQLYYHLSSDVEIPTEKEAMIRLNATHWEMAMIATTALASPSRAVEQGDFPREVSKLIRRGLLPKRADNPEEVFTAWNIALEALDGYRASFNIRFDQMVSERNVEWIARLAASENKEIALVARVCLYLADLDHTQDVAQHWKTIQSMDGFSTVSQKNQKWVYNYIPTAMEKKKGRNDDLIISGAKGLTITNITTDLLQRVPISPSRTMNDWINRDGNEFLCTDAGVFAVTGRGSFRAMGNAGAERLEWDGRHLWCFAKTGIRVLTALGEELAYYPSDILPFPAIAESMFFIPLEHGWGCLVGGEKTEDIKRSWVVGLDIRTANQTTPPRFTMLHEGVNQKRNQAALNVAFLPQYATRFGLPNEHKIITAGFRTGFKMVIDLDKNECFALRQSKFVADYMLEHGGYLWAITSHYGHKRQSWGVLKWDDTTKDAQSWYTQASYTYNVPAFGSGIFQSMFVDKHHLHLISKPWHYPAWFSVDLETKRVSVVADQLPRELDDFRLHPRFVRSSAYGLVFTSKGEAYGVTIPPFESLPPFSVPVGK